MGANAVRGIITFALGGLVLVIDLFFNGVAVFTGGTAGLGSVLGGFAIAFIGFLLVGVGLWAMIQDAVASRAA